MMQKKNLKVSRYLTKFKFHAPVAASIVQSRDFVSCLLSVKCRAA